MVTRSHQSALPQLPHIPARSLRVTGPFQFLILILNTYTLALSVLALVLIVPDDEFPALTAPEVLSLSPTSYTVGILARIREDRARLQRLYEWSAQEFGQPGPCAPIRDSSPTYAWSHTDRPTRLERTAR
jgi:hypothetical protein